MSIEGRGETIADASRERPAGGSRHVLRAAALIAAVAGGVGSVLFLLAAGRRNSSLLLVAVLFSIWVLSPFMVLLWANLVSRRWSELTGAAIHHLTLVLAVVSLAVYSEVVPLKPEGSPNVFLFVIVPPVTWIVMALVVTVAALMARKRPR